MPLLCRCAPHCPTPRPHPRRILESLLTRPTIPNIQAQAIHIEARHTKQIPIKQAIKQGIACGMHPNPTKQTRHRLGPKQSTEQLHTRTHPHWILQLHILHQMELELTTPACCIIWPISSANDKSATSYAYHPYCECGVAFR